MTNTPTETRETYVNKVWEGKKELLNEIKEIQSWQENNSDKDLEENENYREPLCVDIDMVADISLSTGGPADGFKLHFGQDDNEPYKGYYYRADWGEYQETKLDNDELDLIFNFYLYGMKPEVK